MKDVKTLERIKLLHPNVRAEVDKIYSEISAALTGRSVCRFTHTLRTISEQDDLYAQGRTKPGKIVTHARGGQSYHNYGLAVDFCLLIDGKEASWDINKDWDADRVSDWMEVVTKFKCHGWEWGGDFSGFKDYPHLQKTFGFTTAQLKSRLENGYPSLT